MEQKHKVRFKGHESFIIREGWLSKGIQEVNNNPKLFFQNYGADDLGVGPNMAKSIRYWLRCGGLLDETRRTEIGLSKLGKILLRSDPYFENLLSYWIVHCNITRNQKQATAWNIFFNHFDYDEFTKEEMEREILTEAGKIAGEQKFSEKSVIDDCDAILRMYVKKNVAASSPEEKNVSPFGILGLLKYSKGVYMKTQPDLNNLPSEVVLYLMIDCIGTGSGMNIDELISIAKGPGKILNLRRTGFVEILEKLEALGLLTMNRTAGLDMVYIPTGITTEDILENYYN